MAPLLEIKGLKTHFTTDDGIVRAVDGVDISINRGETLCVVGESGCGKTVTAMSILQLIAMPPGRIVAGQIIFEGRDLVPLTSHQLDEVRAKYGWPWHNALLEDYELGLRVLLSGYENRYVHDTYVAQEGLTSFRRLITQRLLGRADHHRRMRGLMRIDPGHHCRHRTYLLTLDAARGPAAGTPDSRRSSLALAPLLSHDHGQGPGKQARRA